MEYGNIKAFCVRTISFFFFCRENFQGRFITCVATLLNT